MNLCKDAVLPERYKKAMEGGEVSGHCVHEAASVMPDHSAGPPKVTTCDPSKGNCEQACSIV